MLALFAVPTMNYAVYAGGDHDDDDDDHDDEKGSYGCKKHSQGFESSDGKRFHRDYNKCKLPNGLPNGDTYLDNIPGCPPGFDR
jgi:hypothetical protein